MLAGPKPRVFTFLHATSDNEKSAMLVNLGASLARAGSSVLLLDACSTRHGIATRLDAIGGATLLDVARQDRALNEVVQAMPQGFGVAQITRGSQRIAMHDAGQMRRLASAFGVLAKQSDIVVVDAELDANDGFPLAAMAAGEIVVQVSTSAASITEAYSIIKRVNAQVG